MEKNQSIGQVLKSRREELKVTAEALAEATGIDRTYISKIENHNFIPSYPIILNLASELDLDEDFLNLYWKKRLPPISKAIGSAALKWARFAGKPIGEKRPPVTVASIMFEIRNHLLRNKSAMIKAVPEIAPHIEDILKSIEAIRNIDREILKKKSKP